MRRVWWWVYHQDLLLTANLKLLVGRDGVFVGTFG